jgi:hypothetical protein
MYTFPSVAEACPVVVAPKRAAVPLKEPQTTYNTKCPLTARRTGVLP